MNDNEILAELFEAYEIVKEEGFSGVTAMNMLGKLVPESTLIQRHAFMMDRKEDK